MVLKFVRSARKGEGERFMEIVSFESGVEENRSDA